jgi:hypothetical protein
MDKKQIEAISDRLVKLAVSRLGFNVGEHFTTHTHVAIRRALSTPIHFNNTRDSDLHRLTTDAGFTTEGRYSLQEVEVQSAMEAMQDEGLILRFKAIHDKSYSSTYISWDLQINVTKFEELYKDRIWKRADFLDDKGDLWKSFREFCRDASARSFMHLMRDPSAFIIQATTQYRVDEIIKPADPSLNPARVLNDASKLRNTLKRAISDHFCESMTLITGMDMTHCLGICAQIETIYWTPTVEDKTMQRLYSIIDRCARLHEVAGMAYEQTSRLQDLYVTHGKGRVFLKWAAAELEKVLFDDPGKYIDDRTFGATAKDMLKYMS